MGSVSGWDETIVRRDPMSCFRSESLPYAESLSSKQKQKQMIVFIP